MIVPAPLPYVVDNWSIRAVLAAPARTVGYSHLNLPYTAVDHRRHIPPYTVDHRRGPPTAHPPYTVVDRFATAGLSSFDTSWLHLPGSGWRGLA